MADVSWSERLVEVIADLGPAGYRYGSGCVVVGKTVLTAAHVIAGAVAVTVRDASKRSYPAEADAAFVGDSDWPGPDLALLQVDELPGDGYPALGLGRTVRDSTVPVVIERCYAFGFPGFAEVPERVPWRDSVQAIGVIAPLSKFTRGLLSMVVSIEPAELSPERVRSGESPWSGMSGGPVVAEERLLGVVVEHTLAEGSSAITVVPLTALEADPSRPLWGSGVRDPAAWWHRLAVGGPADLRPVPTPSARTETAEERTSAYLAQVVRIAPAELLGRARELDELAEFCTAPSRGPYLWFRAPAWVGKSALLSWFALHPPPDIRVVSFFVTARFASQDDRVAFADAVLEQTLALRGQPVPALLTESTRDAHMLTQLSEAAALCRARGERLVLIVDGLDEDRGADGHSIAALLPARPIAGMRVIVTSRPNPPLPPDVREDHPLQDPAAERTLAQSPHAALTRASTQRELKRLLADQSGDRELLGLVAAAGGGLTAQDLGELTGRLAWQVEDRLHATAGRTFVTRAGSWQDQEAYVLGHEELQNDAVRLLGDEALVAYRQRLHDWADTYAGRGWPDTTPDFLLQGYLRLVRAAGPLARMVGVVTDSARQTRMLVRSGAESAAAAELAATQDEILARDPPDLTAMATVAVHRDVMIRRNRSISADLPALWASLGAYTRAEALAQSINDPAQRAAALRSVAAVAAVASPPGPSDTPSAGSSASPGPGAPAAPDLDEQVKLDVHTLISAARSTGGATAAALFDAAAATAYTARDPDVRADLWNDVAWATDSTAVGADPPTGPGASLVNTSTRLHRLDDVVRRAVAIGDIDRAVGIARVTDSGLLMIIVEQADKAVDADRAEKIAYAFPAGRERTDALNWLKAMSIETGALARAERIARVLLAIERAPTALLQVARAARDGGDPEHARRLITEALSSIREPSSWNEEEPFLDAVRATAEMCGVEEALCAARRAHGDTWVQALLVVAGAACDRGEDAHARALAARVLHEATPPDPGSKDTLLGWQRARRLDDALVLLARSGEMEQARASAMALDDPRQTALLTRMAKAALEAGDVASAEGTCDLIADPSARDGLLPSFFRAHLRGGNLEAAMTVARRTPGAGIPARLVTEVVRQALDEGALDTAAALIPAARGHDVQVALRIEVARAAVESAAPAQAQSFLEAAETAARSAPDPAWRAEALTAAAWALLPAADIARIGTLVAAAEAAARQVPDAAPRASALLNVAVLMAATGDPSDAEVVFEEAADASPIPCAWAEHLADRARAAADRGHYDVASAQLSALGGIPRWIAEPNNRVRAVQARLAAAIHIGDLSQAEDAARAIEHPDQQPLALVDVARAFAANGQAEHATTIALTITNEDRQADALSEVARLTAARGQLDLAERAARAVTVRGGQPPALLSVAWEAARAGDLARAEQIVGSITDQEWRLLGLHTIHAQHDASAAARTRSETTSVITGEGRQPQNPLDRIDATPDHPSAARLLAEAMRARSFIPALAPLSRVDPSAVLAAADTLLSLLQ